MKLILDRWQGLGDNLQVSTIPRRLYEMYGEKCVVISDSIYYRNNEIRQLVWEKNPYVAGFTNEAGENLTHKLRYDGVYWIANWERAYGITAPYSPRPEIYHTISDIDTFNVKHKILIDLSFSKESYDKNITNRFQTIINIKKYMSQFNPEDLLIVSFKNLSNNMSEFWRLVFPNETNVITVESIWDYCEMIKHCKHYICSHSGCHPLAASIRNSLTCFIPQEYLNIKYFAFEGVEYIGI